MIVLRKDLGYFRNTWFSKMWFNIVLCSSTLLLSDFLQVLVASLH
jgi:hypothetical protein